MPYSDYLCEGTKKTQVLISLRIKRKYESAKHTTVAAINPLTCGHTTSKLSRTDKGEGIAPAICSMVSGPRLRTEGISRVVVASAYNWLGTKRRKVKMIPL
jgi:hypothetical protein